jgi:hypothetical protein
LAASRKSWLEPSQDSGRARIAGMISPSSQPGCSGLPEVLDQAGDQGQARLQPRPALGVEQSLGVGRRQLEILGLLAQRLLAELDHAAPVGRLGLAAGIEQGIALAAQLVELAEGQVAGVQAQVGPRRLVSLIGHAAGGRTGSVGHGPRAN